ncbi:MAG: hypothetical protein AB7S54_09750 [Bacteroidales bacterium]
MLGNERRGNYFELEFCGWERKVVKGIQCKKFETGKTMTEKIEDSNALALWLLSSLLGKNILRKLKI